jgi:hypothetical protein
MTGMSTVKDVPPKPTDPSFEAGARAHKIERLLTVFEAHVAVITGRNGTFHPATDLDDARLVRDVARASLKAETVVVEVRDPRGRLYRKTTYPFWVEVAELAGLPEHRIPSADTVRALARRCQLRVKDIEENPNPFAGIVIAAAS